MLAPGVADSLNQTFVLHPWRGTVAAVRIVVDHERCQGHGRCYDLAPEVLDADDDGHIAVLVPGGQVPAGAETQAVLAFRNCPERALSLES
jgi:ferredoxin